MKLQGKCRVVGENRMEKIKLTDICNPKQWKTIPTSELLEDGYPVYGANGIIGYYSEFNHKNPVITVTCRGATCGTINITVPKSYVTGNAMCLDDVRSDIYMEYLYYCLKHYNFNNVISGSAQPQITRQGMEKIYVTIGSHNEQMDIVDKLKKVENVIGLKKQELKQLDTFVKSRFVELFGDPYVNPLKWKRLKIKDAVTIEPQNGLYKPQSDYVADGTGTPILRIDGFYNGRVTDFGSLKRLKCSGMEQQRYLLLEDDIVINRVNSIEYLGKCAHIKGLLEDTVYESNMMRMHFDPEHYNPVYICKLLCSQYIYDQIVNHAKKAVNQASINQKDVLDFNIYQPPLELQNQFADFVVSVDKSKSKIQKSLEETQLLFDSLMQKYFG